MATKTITAERRFYSVSQGWRNDGCRQGYHTEIGLITGYLRFPGASIPKGATINSAILTVTLGSSGLGSGADKKLTLHGHWSWHGDHMNDDDFSSSMTVEDVKNGHKYNIDVTDIIKNSGHQYEEDIKIYCFRNEEKHSGYDYSYNYLSISSATLKIDYTPWTSVGKPGKPEASPISYNHKRTNAGTWYFKGTDPDVAEKITWTWAKANGGTNNKVDHYRYAIYRNKNSLGSVNTKDANVTTVEYALTDANRGDNFFLKVRAIGEHGDESDTIDSDYYYVNYAPSISSVSYPATMDLSQGAYSVNFYTLDKGGTLHGQVSTTGPMKMENSVQIGEQTKTNIGAENQTAEFNTSDFYEYAGSSCPMCITSSDGMVETKTKEYTINVGARLDFGLEWDSNQDLKMVNVYIDGKVDHSSQTTGTLLVYDFQSKTYCDLGITGREWHISDIIQTCVSKGYSLTKGSFLDSEGKLSIQCKGKSNGSQGLTNIATTTVAISDMNINNNDVSIVIDGGYRAESAHPELVDGLKVKVKYALSNDFANKGTLWFNYKFSFTLGSGLSRSFIYPRLAIQDGEFYTRTFSASEISNAVGMYKFSIDVQPVFKIGDKTAAIGEYVSGLYNGTISTFQPYIPATLSLYEGTDGLDKEALAPSGDPDSITLPLIMEGDTATRYYQINKAVISYGNGSVEVPLGYKVNTLIVGSDQSIYPTKNAMLKVVANIESGVETKVESGVENLIKYAKITEITIVPVDLGNLSSKNIKDLAVMLNLDTNENITCTLTWQEMGKETKTSEVFNEVLDEGTSQLEVSINTFSKPYFPNGTTLEIEFKAVNSND